MPEIGEIRKAQEIGYKGYRKRVWAACEICGKERWQELLKGILIRRCCPSCASQEVLNRPEVKAKLKSYVGKETSQWKGGRRKTPKGYILIRVYPDDFFFPMANSQGYVYEHRLVVAKAKGRCLQSWEIVHHKGIRFKGIKNRSDNLEDNLQLNSDMRHKQISILERRIKQLETRVTLLKAENELLKR